MPDSKFQFGTCLLDLERRELSRDGALVPLQPRVFDLLVFLVTHRERAVGKDELMDAVWPGRIITETALTRAVMKARKAIGDDASRQEAIRTVHGHGYRFVAEVEAPSETGQVGQADTTGPSDPSGQSVQSDLLRTAGPVARADPGVRAVQDLQEAGPTEPDPARPAAAGWRLPAVLLFVLLALAWLAIDRFRSPMQASESRLAVLPVIDRSGDPQLSWTRLGLMGFANGLLDEAPELSTVADAQVLQLTLQQGWEESLQGASTRELAVDLADIHGATHVLVMEVLPDSTGLRMNWALYEGGRAPRLGTMVGAEGTSLARGVVQAVYGELLGRSQWIDEAPVVSADPFLNEAFARGLGLSLEGRCAEAERYFRVVIDAEPQLFAPRFQLASCLQTLGRIAEAEPLLRTLVAEEQARGNDHALTQALLVLGRLLTGTGRLDESEATLNEGLATARAAEDHEMTGQMLHALAIVAENRNLWAASAQLLDEAVLAFHRAGLDQVPGPVIALRANLAMNQGRMAEGDVYLQEAVDAFRRVGDRRQEAMMLNNRGYLRREQGRYDEAEAFHLQSLAIREEIGDRVGVGRIHSMLAIVRQARGDFDGAREAALEAGVLTRESGDRLFEAIASAQLGEAERSLGHTEEARAAFRHARETLRDIDDEMRALQVDGRLAQLALDEGDVEAATSMATAMLESARRLGQMQPELDALELLGDAARAKGDSPAAIAHYQAALEAVRTTEWTGREGQLLVKLANEYLEAGDLEAAAPLVGAAAELDESPDRLKLRARFAFQAGDAPEAVRLMDRARALSVDQWNEDDDALLAQYQAGMR